MRIVHFFSSKLYNDRIHDNEEVWVSETEFIAWSDLLFLLNMSDLMNRTIQYSTLQCVENVS